ncbi:ShlB/FhaC/HecB family hemolysin secretion/activation protein [Falsigemmobacter faecalis]|nr:ShlB/FhaC/HecB family hemolysin secretion/activation protein [Falsigemmobacter faecalis]
MIRKAALALALLLPLPATAAGPQFTLTRIETPASVYLNAAEIAGVTADYTARPITFDDLQQMMHRLQGLYEAAGVPTAEAVLPAQDIHGGVLKVDFIEAAIEQVEVKGNGSTNPLFFRQALSLREGEKPDFTRLERELRVLAQSHDLAPGLDFAPGAQAAGTRVTITGNEPKNLRFALSADNHGRDETGRQRLQASVQWASLTGWRDRLGLNVTRTSGAWSAAVSYDRPVGTAGGRLVFGIHGSNSQVIGGSFSGARVVSDAAGFSLGYRFALQMAHDRSLYASFGMTHDRTQSEIAGVQFVDTKLNEITAELSYRRSIPLTEFGGTARLRAGSAKSAGGALTDGGYGVLQFSGFANRRISEGYALTAALDGQMASKLHLPVARQFGVGGTEILRGYPSDVRAAPEALALRLQLVKLDPWRMGGNRLAIQPYVFADAAILRTSASIGSRTTAADRLFSAGFGANFTFDGRYGLHALVGVPLRPTTGFTDSGSAIALLGISVNF